VFCRGKFIILEPDTKGGPRIVRGRREAERGTHRYREVYVSSKRGTDVGGRTMY